MRPVVIGELQTKLKVQAATGLRSGAFSTRNLHRDREVMVMRSDYHTFNADGVKEMHQKVCFDCLRCAADRVCAIQEEDSQLMLLFVDAIPMHSMSLTFTVGSSVSENFSSAARLVRCYNSHWRAVTCVLIRWPARLRTEAGARTEFPGGISSRKQILLPRRLESLTERSALVRDVILQHVCLILCCVAVIQIPADVRPGSTIYTNELVNVVRKDKRDDKFGYLNLTFFVLPAAMSNTEQAHITIHPSKSPHGPFVSSHTDGLRLVLPLGKLLKE